MKKFIQLFLKLVLILLFIVGIYLGYMQLTYYRIADNTDLTNQIKNNSSKQLDIHQEYTALTSNFGFGAYDHSFSFFVDEGMMKDGTRVKGTYSRARSKEAVETNLKQLISVLKEQHPDFILMQEVDTHSSRSYNINQVEAIENTLSAYASVFDCNMHVPYLFYPLTHPHGYSNSGLLSLSKYQIQSATHRQLYVSSGFIEKFVDLDRCLTTIRIPVGNGKELVLVNLHLSAYDKGGLARKKQMDFLAELMETEYAKGNYMILGGDYNHSLSENYKELPTKQLKPEWVYPFPQDVLNPHFRIVHADNANEAGTCRGADLPYQKGISYILRIDGFIVSDNIEASSEIIDTDFLFSDHNPVLLKFQLK